MANEYVAWSALKVPLGITDSVDDTWGAIVATATSRSIDRYCGRRFYADANATARYFQPRTSCVVAISDCYSITSVKTDDDDDGTAETTWDAGDYETCPANLIGPNGYEGWPITELRSVETRYFPTLVRRRNVVEVTAKWGWSAVPTEVQQACYILGSELYHRKTAPFGVAGINDFGVIRIREDARLVTLLETFQRAATAGLIA